MGEERMSSKRGVVKVVVSSRTDRNKKTVPPKTAIQNFKNATRIQGSLTSALERRALLWLAARMSSRIGSDHLTCLGFTAMLFAGGSYLLARWHPSGLLIATLFLAVNWFGDSLDGTLARLRQRQRPRYGFYVDHMIDSFGGIFLIGGLGASGYVNWQIALSMLIAFLLLSIESYLAAYTLGIFRLSFAKFGPTEIRILLALGNIALWFNPKASLPVISWRLFDFGGIVATSGMAIMVVVAAAWHTMILYKQETLS
jgi:phosphatidylglycerophosphate synthase